ncbi:MAG: hypothetical protein GEV11_19355 [Streptosporangiales bacterium]|nr:hypothetical protein [Streptosporangiales bacterium]
MGRAISPQIVPKHARRVEGFDEAIVSLYAKGLTTGEIRAHLAEIYQVEVSKDLISRVTDKVVVPVWYPDLGGGRRSASDSGGTKTAVHWASCLVDGRFDCLGDVHNHAAENLLQPT